MRPTRSRRRRRAARGEPAGAQRLEDRVADAQARVDGQPRRLEHELDAVAQLARRAHAPRADARAVDRHGAAVGLQQQREDLRERALARPARADEPEPLARRERERDALSSARTRPKRFVIDSALSMGEAPGEEAAGGGVEVGQGRACSGRSGPGSGRRTRSARAARSAPAPGPGSPCPRARAARAAARARTGATARRRTPRSGRPRRSGSRTAAPAGRRAARPAAGRA